MKLKPFTLCILMLIFLKGHSQDVFFTTGFKISEITSDRVVIWTRLCGQAFPNSITHERRSEVFRHPIQFDENQPIDKMDGGVKGINGYVRFILKDNQGNKKISPWKPATSKHDYCVFHVFEGLKNQHTYQLIIEGKKDTEGMINTDTGYFKTSPKPNERAPLLLTTSSCQYFWSFDDSINGFKIYNEMSKLHPDLFVQTGDFVYYDKPGPMADQAEKARHKWHAMNAWPYIRRFFRHTPIYLLKDDHDLLADDVHSTSKPFGKLTYSEGLEIWKENVPLLDKPYRTITWGKDIQFWLMEGREFRSDNTSADDGTKTIWGEEQKNWLIQSVQNSKATFKIIISPTPIIGPDRASKADNHANNAFQKEGDWVRTFLHKENMIVINGDRHWQYVSQDIPSGVMEFGSGPVSDFHAQGWPPEEIRPEHKFLRVAGGFLSLSMEYKAKEPYLTFIHYDVNGKAVHSEIIKKTK